ncbi:MAG: hypothetical protein QM805_26025, partial [Pseudomonas sp.]
FPEMFRAISDYGITSRAVKQELIQLQCFNPRSNTEDRHQTVDDRPFGGGPGMVMKIKPLEGALGDARQAAGGPVKVIYLSPQGRKLTQAAVKNWRNVPPRPHRWASTKASTSASLKSMLNEKWSDGDYVLSGGELPAMVLIDAVTRVVARCIGPRGLRRGGLLHGWPARLSALHPDLRCTQTNVFLKVLRSAATTNTSRRWRLQQSLRRTWERRADLLNCRSLSGEEKAAGRNTSASGTIVNVSMASAERLSSRSTK